MFTGIVEELGVVESISGTATHARLQFRASRILDGVKLGDSIAVNGVCLTVTSFTSSSFTADVMPETMKQTNLGSLQRGERVNLERAMQVGSRFGGHIVSGHVDGTGVILSRQPFANAVLYRIQTEPSLLRYMISRGSITVNGISLTLVEVAGRDFTVSIIPHTLANTNLADMRAGEVVNLECDLIGKYVERLLSTSMGIQQADSRQPLSADFLRDNGFL